MHDVGDILCCSARAQVGIVAQKHGLLRIGNTLGIEPLLGQDSERHGIDLDGAQRTGVITAAPRILVDPIDKLSHGGAAVADHHRWPSVGRCHHPPTHDQYAIVSPWYIPLHHDRR